MKKIIFLVIGAIILFLAVNFFVKGPQESGGEEKFIVANPVDLSQIASISQFRSCMGHDYSGKNVNGEKETNRSMKHYFAPAIDLDQSKGKMKVFSPFDGKIASIEDEQDPRGIQVWLNGSSTGHWNFIIFHIDLSQEFTKDSEVKAGQLIGYADLDGGANFDFALKKFGFGGQTLDSLFNYMSEEVLAEYEKVGVTSENIILAKEQREANPCNFGSGSGFDEQVFLKEKFL